MEASVAAQGQGTGEAQAQQGEAAQPGQDVGQLASQLEAMANGQEELRQFLMTQPWQPAEAEQETGEDQFDLSFLNYDDPGFDPNTVAERLGGLIDQAAERRTQAAVQPLAEKLQTFESQQAEARRVAEAERLVAEFPELGDRGTAQEVVSVARQIAEAQNRPELAQEPWFWRMTYMAGRAAEAANAESADPQTAFLEGGAGARPGGAPEVDLGEQIVSGGRAGRSVLPFG